MDTIGNGNSQNQNDSYFDGNTWQLIGYRILSFIVCTITLGIAYPWMRCMVQGWETGHTVIHGRRLKFDGHGHQLIGKFLLWVFLTVITFGIYGIWFGLGMKKWIVKHTAYADEKEPVDSYFSGGAAGYFGVHITSFILTLFTLGIGKAWADKMVLEWETGHTHIGGSPLEFNGTGGQLFVNYLLLVILTPLTLGIYALFFTVIYKKWQVKHTEAVYQTSEVQAKARAHETTVMQDFVKYRLAANDQEVAAIKSGYTGKEDSETLERMAEENNPYASYYLAKQLKGDATLYEGRALQLLQKAADGKYHPALLDLAKQLPSGQDVLMLTEAAQRGNAEASWLLTAKYQATADLPQAAYWFKIALEWGIPDAKNRADEYDALVKNIAIQLSENRLPTKQTGIDVVPLILGMVGLMIWIIPMIGSSAGLMTFYSRKYWYMAGLPIVIAGLVTGIIAAIKKKGKGKAIAGIALNAVCMILLINHFHFLYSHRLPYENAWSQGNQINGQENAVPETSAGSGSVEYIPSSGQTDESSVEDTGVPVSLEDIINIHGRYYASNDGNGSMIEYIINESAFFDKDRHLLYINFGLINYEDNNVKLKYENGWCTQSIAPGFGITEVSYPYEELPLSIEVWSESGYHINSHTLNVTEGTSTEWEEWYEQKYGDAYFVGVEPVELDAINGIWHSFNIRDLTIEYIMNESVYFDRDRQILYIQFGVPQSSCYMQLRCENGWYTEWIIPGYGITEVSYPFEEPPSSIEVWADSHHYFLLVNSHTLNVTEGTSAQVNEWLGQDTPAVSETDDMYQNIVGEWEWYDVYTTAGDPPEPELRRDRWIFNPDGTYESNSVLCLLSSPDSAEIYYDGQYWFVGAAGGSGGSYTVNDNEIILQGVNYNEGNDINSVYTIEFFDGEVLCLRNEWNEIKEYRRAN